MSDPRASLDIAYSDDEAVAVPWAAALARLAQAQLAWIVTVRPDGRPHATPMVPVVHDGKVYFHVGRDEVKTANLRANPNAIVLVGDGEWEHGLDVMVDGTATVVTDPAVLRAVAARYRDRWDGRWRLEVEGGDVSGTARGVDIVVFGVMPRRARSHDKGDPFGQTTYRFAPERADAQDGSS